MVTLFDIVREGATRWLVMEYVQAQSLAEVIAGRGPSPPREVARIGAEIAGALEAVHAAGVVHRDVKPGNLLVADTGKVKLTDFGISRGTWSAQTLTSAMVVGTPAYIAPEVAAATTRPRPRTSSPSARPCSPPSRASRPTAPPTIPWRCCGGRPPARSRR